MSDTINRRDFVKLLSTLALVPYLDGPQPAIRRAPLERSPVREAQTKPNVLVIVFDTLSAAHMSLYGYRRDTTPNLARFAERASVYHAHYAGGNFTSPGTSTLLTGMYPWIHRAFNQSGLVDDRVKDQNLFAAFAGSDYYTTAYSHNYLANNFLWQFRNHIKDYVSPRTFCLFDGDVADLLFPNDADIATRGFEELILRRGSGPPSSLFLSLFDRMRLRFIKQQALRKYAELYPKGTPELFKLSFVLEEVIDGIHARLSALPQPFLAYFHLLPPHEPYLPRREYIGIFKDGWKPHLAPHGLFTDDLPDKELLQLRREYDEYLAYADAEFGRLFDSLARSGLLDSSYVVFTSDHGQLFERGVHGHVTPLLNDPVIRVPLLISRPGQQQREDYYTPTSCVDLLPTLLDATGHPVPEWCEGQILPGFAAEGASYERSVWSLEAKSNPKNAPFNKASVALVRGDYKLIRYFGYGTGMDEYELYDLANDPGERDNLYHIRRGVAAALQDEMAEKLRLVNQPFLRQA